LAANHRLLKMAGFDLPGTGRFCLPADILEENGTRRPLADLAWEIGRVESKRGAVG
jgi:hypothetical protein